MAILLQPGFRVLDASGVPVSGGKVRVYSANTTTLSDVFSDPGLSVPLANPVICNPEGYPSSNGTTPVLVYLASGNFDVAALSAGDVVLRTWDDVPSVGSDNATLTRDFGERFQVDGVGGAIRIQAGDPSPDNVGGTMEFTGWEGTDLDTLTAKTALFNVTGEIQEGGKKLPGVIQTEATTFTTVASVDIALPEAPADVRGYEVVIFDLVHSGSVGTSGISLQTSHDGGGSYKAGASDYSFYLEWYDNGANAMAALPDDAATSAALAAGLHVTITVPQRIVINLITPEGATGRAVGDSVLNGWSMDDHPVRNVSTFFTGNYGRVTNIRIAFTGGGTSSGKYLVQPLRGYGEA